MDPDNYDAWLRSNTMYGEINRNKYSVAMDLHSGEGKELFKRLVAESDIVLENFHYATLPRWGMSYEDLRKVNPRIIVLSAPATATRGLSAITLPTADASARSPDCPICGATPAPRRMNAPSRHTPIS